MIITSNYIESVGGRSNKLLAYYQVQLSQSILCLILVVISTIYIYFRKVIK